MKWVILHAVSEIRVHLVLKSCFHLPLQKNIEGTQLVVLLFDFAHKIYIN